MRATHKFFSVRNIHVDGWMISQPIHQSAIALVVWPAMCKEYILCDSSVLWSEGYSKFDSSMHHRRGHSEHFICWSLTWQVTYIFVSTPASCAHPRALIASFGSRSHLVMLALL